MSCCDTGHLLPFNKALSLLLEAVTPVTETQQVPLDQALDHILADTIRSPLAVPGYDNSAMDGYALIASDLNKTDTLQLIGKSLAGHPFDKPVCPGECVRVMTGAKMPLGADCVIMQENTELQGDYIRFSKRVKPGDNIRRSGEDIQQGAIVLSQGKRLTPADLGLLSSIGCGHVTIYRRLKIGLFSTGDELRIPSQPLAEGCIYDSNRVVIKAILQRLGCHILDLGIIPDQPEKLKAAFAQCESECDVIISSGGVSVGEADYTKDILEQLGDIHFWKVAIKPGKPFAFGQLGQAVFFGLPGNPVSAAVTFHQLALPALLKMAGETANENLTLLAKTIYPLKKRPGRTDFQRGILSRNRSGELVITDTGGQGSGMLSSMSHSNAYIKLPQDANNIAAEELVEVIPYDRWLG